MRIHFDKMNSGCTCAGAHTGADFFGNDKNDKNDKNDMSNLSNMSLVLVFQLSNISFYKMNSGCTCM